MQACLQYEGFGGRPPVGGMPGARAPWAPLKSGPASQRARGATKNKTRCARRRPRPVKSAETGAPVCTIKQWPIRGGIYRLTGTLASRKSFTVTRHKFYVALRGRMYILCQRDRIQDRGRGPLAAFYR